MDIGLNDMRFTRILPIGIRDYEDLRRRKCLYVDKTAYSYPLF